MSLLYPLGMNCQVVYEVQPEGLLTNSLNGAKEDIENRLMYNNEEDFIVILDDGTYFLDEPLIFDGNSISSNNSITFIAKEGTNPIISGGYRVSSWNTDDSIANKGKIIKAKVNSDVRNLWINNIRMNRAHGYVGYSTGLFDETVNGIKLKGLLFPKENFPCFEDISGLEIKYYKNWRNYYFKVDAIYNNTMIPNISEDQVLVVIKDFDVALEVTPKMIYVGSSEPYYFENSIELLDEPGEWCYSPKYHTIYYYPDIDENPNSIDAVVPKLQNLIVIRSSDSDNKIENIIFSGLEFSHTNWSRTSEKGFFPKQSSTYCIEPDTRDVIPAAIMVEDAKNLKFERCKFSHLGSSGIHIKDNAESIYTENNTFSDLSGTAVCISDFNHRTYSDTVKPVKSISIKNNYIENIGEEYASCSGIEAYFCENLMVGNNELYNLPYTGISVGWGWTAEPTTQKNIKILNNKIIGNTLKCSDGGAIYTLSHFGGDGLLIEGNYVEEISNKPCAFTQGSIYMDEGSSNVQINNNVVLADRQWFYHHWAGKVEVDSTYVLSENHYNYGGVNTPGGGTEIKYVDNGAHIFNIPHEAADRIIKNAGIKYKEPDISTGIDYIFNGKKGNFDLILTSEGLRIILQDDMNDEIVKVKVFGLDGSLRESLFWDQRLPLELKGIGKGFYIIEVICGNQRRVKSLIL